ncbi:MaoC family dehydratase [Natronobeatus ordinarius]|uniref:MaoC family dehydratase n=1 Tax=Natronobeatus ordinarius TaxID=2963433 RepID=UPI0020CCA779|nr:MaoC family dehydratase [Natronobeatus ordinarius]
MLEANRATLAALGVPEESVDDSESELEDGGTVDRSIQHEHERWEYDRTVDEPTAIDVGDVVTFSKTISEEDVRAFAHASGDTNRLHLDDAFATETRFGGRIVHGTLVSGLISAALARIPGLTVYLSQDLEFVAPVSIGEELTARVEVVESLGGDRYRLETIVENEADVVVNGEAVVMVDDAPETDSGYSTR